MSRKFIINDRKIKSKQDDNDIIFLRKCADHAPDDFWYDQILEMSQNNYPEGLTYQKGKLITDSIVLSLSIDPGIACNQIILLLKDHLGILSDNESADESDYEDAIKVKSYGDSWTTMLKRNKEQAISRFIMAEQKKRDLSFDEQERLQQIINIGLISGSFNKNNIYVDNYMISNIVGLNFDAKTRCYYIDSNIKRVETRSSCRSTAKPKKTYNNVWDNIVKYINLSTKITGDQENDDDYDEDNSRMSY